MTRTPPSPAPVPLRSIAEVERDTGVARATIRIWERRYGFPAPLRDDRGERVYPDDQVEQLRLMKQLLDQGHRPARLVAAGAEGVKRLAAGPATKAAPRPRAASKLLRLLRDHDAQGLRQELQARLDQLGLARFAGQEIATMNTLVGDAWASGELEIHQEHLYSDSVYEVVRTAIAALGGDVRPEAPQVLLTTFPQEPHGLGLLMAQAMFALEGCPTVSLGVRLPIEQIAASARAYRADLVGLSFTGCQNPTHVQRGLEELRGMLPAAIRIWAGGVCPALAKRPIPGVRVVRDVRAVPGLLAEEFALPPREKTVD
ncbi:MAG: MerR family transcriptional regulator [Stagnimonas sp.]|nr:MerR family transcriptional regulator [Stagnimonas sp.]